MDAASSIAHYEPSFVTNNDARKLKLKEKAFEEKQKWFKLVDKVGMPIEERKSLCIGLNTFQNDRSKFKKNCNLVKSSIFKDKTMKQVREN